LIHTLCTLYILQCTLYIVHSWHFVVLYFITIPCRTVLNHIILYHVTIGNMLYYYIVLCQTARRNAGCEQVCDSAGPSLRVCGVVHIPCDSPSQVYSLGHSSYRCTVGLFFIATGEPRLAHSVAVANKVTTSGAQGPTAESQQPTSVVVLACRHGSTITNSRMYSGRRSAWRAC